MTGLIVIVLVLGTFVIAAVCQSAEWKRANQSRVVPVACEGFPCTNPREYGTLWCKKHQPRKLQLNTLEERLL